MLNVDLICNHINLNLAPVQRGPFVSLPNSSLAVRPITYTGVASPTMVTYTVHVKCNGINDACNIQNSQIPSQNWSAVQTF